MRLVKRLRLFTGLLGVAAAIVVIGNTVFGDIRTGRNSGEKPQPTKTANTAKVADEMAKNRFADEPTLTYKTVDGTNVFAWQIKPTIKAEAAPRDIQVLVDTSASQAGKPMKMALAVLESVVKVAGPDDKIDVWTININDPKITRSLTQGFQPANDKAVSNALATLKDAEYGAGAVDLKAGLERAAKQFAGQLNRKQVMLYLGDGESAASHIPINEAARIELGNWLAEKEIAFFAVPVGTKVHSHNIHGLSTTSGGNVVRITHNLATVRGKEVAGQKLMTAFDAPIVYVDRASFGDEVADFFPTRLPPLRADKATLVLGTLKGDTPTLKAKVEGRINGKAVSLDLTERVTTAKPENYFLNAMLEQWRTAEIKDGPAILPADRALAMANTQFGLFRDEFVAQGVWAIQSDLYEHAEKLFEAATKIDPNAAEAVAGIRVVQKIRSGDLSKEKLKANLAKGEAGRQLQDLGGDDVQPGSKPATPPAGDPAIERARAAQEVQEQEFRVLVDETLRRARRLRNVDPDAAYQDLKRQREVVLENDQLSLALRRRLVGQLDDSMRYIQTQGAEIKRRLDAERERISSARQRLTDLARTETQERQTQARIDQFKQLMQRARFEEAYQEAQVMIAERVDQGRPIPVESYASYRIGQSAYNLREAQELKRIRQNNYLLTMMQVEKSFIPYPDEPPVHFPPARVWQELTAMRTAQAETRTLGPNTPQSLLEIRDTLENQPVFLETPLQNLRLRQLIDTLEEQYKIPFFIREDLFRVELAGEDITDKQFRITSKLNGVKLGNFLDVVLLDIDASYIVRPEYVEIVPRNYRLTEKQFRVFEVGDLVIPIPNSINEQALQQNLAVFGAQLNTAGQALGAANFLGGAFGGFGGGGGLGGGGALGGGALGGGGAFGAGLGAQGAAGNLGIDGGVAGVTGGQLGQFGNLGGQFGIQGGNQANILIDLIRTVVAYKEWDSSYVGVQPTFGDEDDFDAGPIVPPEQLNSLGYYPPSLGLVVRGSTRYHPNQSFKLKGDGGLLGMGPGPNRKGDKLAGVDPKAEPKEPKPEGAVVAEAIAQAGQAKKKLRNPRNSALEMLLNSDKKPQNLWNEAFDWTLTDPNLVVTAAEFLFDFKEYGHAAEALKAAIRKGRSNNTWVFEALTLALEQSQASPAEIERAALSAIDLDPTDSKAYLKAASVSHDLGMNEQAVAYAKRAASLEPNLPDAYSNVLAFAENSGDIRAEVVEWAAGNLLRRDWQADGIDYHLKARQVGSKLADKYKQGGDADAAARLEAILAETTERDLVVELLWQGPADLDLTVDEPTGSVCSATHPITTGGGVLKSDILEQRDDNRSESYSAVEAFPGKYTIRVHHALGRATGNRARVMVKKYAGTDREEMEIHSVDLADPKPITVELSEGSRTELASIPQDDPFTTARSTRGSASKSSSGISAGGGAVSTNLLTTPAATNTAKAMPLVAERLESSLPGIGSGLSGVRVEARMSSDRSQLIMTANPVFTQSAGDVPLPKVNLLPGAPE